MPRETLDLSGVPCPANSARALLYLEGMNSGSELKIIVDDGEPSLNLPDSLIGEGYTIIEKRRKGKKWIILVRKNDELSKDLR